VPRHRQPNGEQPFVCSNCDGALELPDDLEVASTTCPYCGEQALLPPHIVAHRKERAHRQREANAAAARAADEARRKRTARKRSVIVGIVVTLAILVSGGGIALLAYANRDVRPRDPASTGHDQVAQWLASLKSRGCDHMVAPPEVIDGSTNWTMNMKRRGNCLTVMAATGVVGNALTLTMRTPFGQPVPASPPGTFVHLTHCADNDGAYPVSVTPATDNFYTYAAIDCPRELYEAPRTDDPNYTGQAYVAARMKALYAAGCTHVVHPAEVIETGIKWTPNLSESKTANCLHLLAATGAPGNTLTLSMQTPFGEQVRVPPPGNAIDFLFCGTSGGPHPITVMPAADDYYTFAAVDCPREKR
jgi:hypothetical protein